MTTADQQQSCPYPFGPAERLEMHPQYARLRHSGSLARITMPFGGDAWLATGYEDVRAVLVDQRFSRASTLGRDAPRLMPMIATDPNILFMDPPRHTRLRNVVSRAFTPRRMEALRQRVEEVVGDLLDAMIAEGPPADLVTSLAAPLPTAIICELLGVPFEDHKQFLAWSEATLAITGYEPEERMAAANALKEYLSDLMAQRRDHPTDDMLGVLAQAPDGEAGFSLDELIIFGITLLVAGDETVGNQIGNFVYILLAHPDQLARLKDDPQLLPGAIEELMRFTPLGAVAQSPSIATEDVEIGGVTVRAGDTVLVHLASANRDESVFDHPDTLDLARVPNPHVGFGFGAHHCIGAHLARIELQVAIGSLVNRLPDLRLGVPAGEIVFKSGRLARGVEALPVTWPTSSPAREDR